MTTVSVKEFSKAWWSEVYNRIIGAAVFIDDATAECLHWDGGLVNLLEGGAVAVKSLSPFESATAVQKKGVFISQTTPMQMQTVQAIIRQSHFTHCILISTVSLDIIYAELNEGKDVSDVVSSGKAVQEATKQLEELLLEWIDKKPSAAEIVHIPIFTIAPTSVTFLTPPFSNLYPSYSGTILPESPSVDLYSLSDEERSSVRRLASNLNSMFDSMNIKEDIFYMGTFSSILAGVLENSPVCTARRKNCSNAASLIIVDGTLDVCGMTSHCAESVLDKVMAVLPRFPGHSTDVAVDMSPLCEANVVSVTEDIQLSPGCVYHANDDTCVQTFDYMINKSQKEVMIDIYNKLSKMDVQRSPATSLLRVTPQSVEKLVSSAKGNYDIIEKHLGSLQQALAVVQTLKSPQHSEIELIMSLQKQVLMNIATSRESTSVLKQLSDLIRMRKERNLSLSRLLALTVHVYSLAGGEIVFSKEHEQSLLETLSVAIFEDNKILLGEAEYDSNIATPEECDRISKTIMQRLRDIGQMRRILKNYNSVIKLTDSGSAYEYRGVLQQLVDDLVDTERPELVDLKHRSDGIKDLLRSGLNILTSKKVRTVKHPLDNSSVIIFVVGGVTAEECKRLHRSVITSGIDAQVVLGSTGFVTPVQAMKNMLQL